MKLSSDECYWASLVNIASGNVLVPLDNRPIPQARLTQFYIAIWRHEVTMNLSIIRYVKLEYGVCVKGNPWLFITLFEYIFIFYMM